MIRILAVISVLSCFLVAALGDKAFSYETGDGFMAHDAWAPPSLEGTDVGVAFAMLMNHSANAVEITNMTSDVAKTVELHDHVSVDGRVKMKRVEKVAIPAGGMIDMKPGGLHLMLIGLKHPLKDGETFTVAFTPKDSKPVNVSFTVSQARLIESLKSRSNSAHEH